MLAKYSRFVVLSRHKRASGCRFASRYSFFCYVIWKADVAMKMKFKIYDLITARLHVNIVGNIFASFSHKYFAFNDGQFLKRCKIWQSIAVSL